ncbi:hypothetical protein RND81_11G219700 [Saponaria officinalis]|uniref:Cyclin-dependent kinase inhibitor domain-containing protein n=1 Tax=Saponaria officinalis TaxID=3572 RepID=A0AAW1HPA4_SAPOF
MRRFVEKCDEEEEEVVVVDSKIRTRAMAEVKRMKMTTTTTKKKNVSVSVSALTTPYNVYELKIRRLRSNPVSSPVLLHRNETTTTTLEDATISTSSIVNCSSNFASSSSSCSSEFIKDCANTSTPEIVADLEVESSGETSSKFVDCNDDVAREVETRKLDEPEPNRLCLDHSTKKSTVEINSSVMPPSESEIEDFFSSAEKDLQKRFSDKYNFDVVKDVPLEGRYEWAEIKP